MEGGKGGRRMKEMIDEARNAHVDPPSHVMGNTCRIRK